ncbi:MAG TPA: hypothetical protein VHS78_15695 [Candidatus Elarobacter sp.]|jgi:hypothetical protein|nr:hypothetical protein [Candidatus Elarobacter sp.]
MHRFSARPAVMLAAVMLAGAIHPAGAQTAEPRPAVIEFDEIDHVFTTEAVPAPGSFRQHAGLVASASPPADQPKRRGILDALGAASSALGNASSVVSASGELGRALRLADGVAKLAPLTTAMGMAGSRRFDALLQTFVLPRVSPSGAVMLQGFLSAQTEYKAHYRSTQATSAQTPPPAVLEPYAKGALRHYTVGSNGWVRIDDPNTNVTLVIKPDLGKAYLIDKGAKTVRTMAYANPSAAPAADGASGTGTASVSDRVEALGRTVLDGVGVSGFRTTSAIRVAGAGAACADITITSTRIEYFAPSRVASQAANVSPAAQRTDTGDCNPAATVAHAGGKIPNDQLMVYQANTVEKKTATGTDRYTVLIERGNLSERNAYDTEPFDIPAGLRSVS